MKFLVMDSAMLPTLLGAAAATTTMFTQALCEEILRAEAKAA